MPSEEGPYVQVACFCETVLQEANGVISLIRIVDTVELESRDPNPPESLPPTNIKLKLVVTIKSGRIPRGRYDLVIEPELPSGLRQKKFPWTIHLEGEERGHTHVTDLQYTVTQEGTHWFRLFLDDEFLTAVPLRVKYSRVVLR